jgi:hypothetical protein
VLKATWALAETLGLSSSRLLLVAFGYFATAGLLQGEPPTWALVGETTNRTLDLILGVVHLGGS